MWHAVHWLWLHFCVLRDNQQVSGVVDEARSTLIRIIQCLGPSLLSSVEHGGRWRMQWREGIGEGGGNRVAELTCGYAASCINSSVFPSRSASSPVGHSRPHCVYIRYIFLPLHSRSPLYTSTFSPWASLEKNIPRSPVSRSVS